MKAQPTPVSFPAPIPVHLHVHLSYVTLNSLRCISQVRCQERDFADFQRHPPVKLVVFDFDETLTLATFMPRSKAITTKVGWNPTEAGAFLLYFWPIETTT